MNYYLKALKNYTVFSGRATRSEFWYFVLFSAFFSITALILDNTLGTTFRIDTIYGPIPRFYQYGYIYLAYGLFILLPSLAIYIRRLHDVGKSGWFLFISLIPLVGAIWLLVLLCTDSEANDNEYGPNPQTENVEKSYTISETN
jgi:uncharacterized membrane protein YhaH (DUF805 family)